MCRRSCTAAAGLGCVTMFDVLVFFSLFAIWRNCPLLFLPLFHNFDGVLSLTNCQLENAHAYWANQKQQNKKKQRQQKANNNCVATACFSSLSHSRRRWRRCKQILQLLQFLQIFLGLLLIIDIAAATGMGIRASVSVSEIHAKRAAAPPPGEKGSFQLEVCCKCAGVCYVCGAVWCGYLCISQYLSSTWFAVCWLIFCASLYCRQMIWGEPT